MTDFEWKQGIEVAIRLAGAMYPEGLVPRLAPQVLSADAAARTAVVAFASEPWMANPAGFVHGGMVSAFADSAMGAVIRGYVETDYSPTIGLQMVFLRPAPLPARICVRVELSNAGKRISYATAEIFCEDAPQRLLATASGQFFAGTGAAEPRPV